MTDTTQTEPAAYRAARALAETLACSERIDSPLTRSIPPVTRIDYGQDTVTFTVAGVYFQAIIKPTEVI